MQTTKNIHLFRLDLISKNNKQNNFYLYSPIVKIDNKYFWAESIKASAPLKIESVSIDTLNIKREIPQQFYEANGLK